MKKIVSMALIAALIVSAAGCGEKAPAETTAKTETTTAATETVKETTAKEAAGENSAEETAETTAEAEETTTTAPEEASEYAGLSMSNPISFKNGSLCFEASNGTKYLYQVAENKIYEINDDWTRINYNNLFKTGDMIWVWYWDHDRPTCYCVVNAATNEVMYKEGNDDLIFRNINPETGRMLVTKVEEGFSGNSISIGVMNNKGEWENPLTEFSIDGVKTDELNNCRYTLMGDYALLSGGSMSYIYSFKDNKISEIEGFGYYKANWDINYDKVIGSNYGGILIIDSTGESKQIYQCERANSIIDMDYFIELRDNGIVIKEGIQGGYKYTVLSADDYKDMGFDLSEYNVIGVHDVEENVIAFYTKNPDGDAYTIIMNKDGSFVTEPFKYGRASDDVTLCGDYEIIRSTKTLLNLKTAAGAPAIKAGARGGRGGASGGAERSDSCAERDVGEKYPSGGGVGIYGRGKSMGKAAGAGERTRWEGGSEWGSGAQR